MDLTGQLLQLLFTGFTLGGIYALIALALVTTFNITGVLNMAQGEFLALGRCWPPAFARRRVCPWPS